MPELTAKQARFAEVYAGMDPRNAAEAARRAGYAPGNANKEGARLLGKPHVRVEIQQLTAERERRECAPAPSGDLDADIIASCRQVLNDSRATAKDKLEALKLLDKAQDRRERRQIDEGDDTPEELRAWLAAGNGPGIPIPETASGGRA